MIEGGGGGGEWAKIPAHAGKKRIVRSGKRTC